MPHAGSRAERRCGAALWPLLLALVTVAPPPAALAQLAASALRVSRGVPSTPMVVVEIEMVTPAGVNAARAGAATASSCLDNAACDGARGYAAAHLINGVVASDASIGAAELWWHSSFTDYQPWAVVSLPAATSIANVSVWLRRGAEAVSVGDAVELLDASGAVVFAATIGVARLVQRAPGGPALPVWSATLPATSPSPTHLRSRTSTPPPTPTRSAAPTPGACRPGWYLPPGSDFCYRAFFTPLSWAGAHEFCRAQGGNAAAAGLATIRSPSEAAYVVGAQCGAGNGSVWVGLNDVAAEAGSDRGGPWAWASGAPSTFITSPAGQALWLMEQPDNAGGADDGEDCVHSWDRSRDRAGDGVGRLNDKSCDGALPAACCEMPRVPLAATRVPTPTPFRCMEQGFESSLLAPFTASPASRVSVVASAARLSGGEDLLLPLTGTYMARLLSGAGADRDTVMSLAVDAPVGASLAFDVRFETSDTGAPYDDAATAVHVFVAGPNSTVGSSTNTTLLRLNVSQVGARGASAWVHGSYTLAQPGRHMLAFTVRDVFDNDNPSQLLVDNTRLCVTPPTPSPGATPSPSPSPGACPPGWSLPPGGDYCFGSVAIDTDGLVSAPSLEEASTVCRLRAGVANASLATIRSQQDAAAAMYAAQDGRPLRIGLNDVAAEAGSDRGGPWAWTSGAPSTFITSPAGQALWLEGRPGNINGNEDCVELTYADGVQGLDDVACDVIAGTLWILCEALRAPLAAPLLDVPCAAPGGPGSIAASGNGLAGTTLSFTYLSGDSVWRFRGGAASGTCPSASSWNDWTAALITLNLGSP